jgi:hypothetical protein
MREIMPVSTIKAVAPTCRHRAVLGKPARPAEADIAPRFFPSRDFPHREPGKLMKANALPA